MYQAILFKYLDVYNAQKDLAEYSIRCVQMHLDELDAGGSGAVRLPSEQQ